MFLLPIFADMFDQLGGELPIFTQIMMNISDFFASTLELGHYDRGFLSGFPLLTSGTMLLWLAVAPLTVFL